MIKAETEKSSLLKLYREKNDWWKFFITEIRRKPFLSRNAENQSKYCRIPALRDRIWKNLK